MWMNLLLTLLVIPLALVNLIGPLLVLRTQKIPARVRFSSVDNTRFMAERDARFKQLDQEVRELDFDHLGSSALQNNQTTSYFSLYAHPREQAAAMLVTMASGSKKVTYAEFAQLYADGTLLDVNNAPVLPSYPRMDCKRGVRLPAVNELKVLLNTLQALRGLLPNSAPAIPYPSDQGFKPIEDFIARESDELARLGYCHAEIDDNGRRALTLKGALLLTWKNAIPGKLILALMEQRSTRNLLTGSHP